jgi:hypothetical protein
MNPVAEVGGLANESGCHSRSRFTLCEFAKIVGYVLEVCIGPRTPGHRGYNPRMGWSESRVIGVGSSVTMGWTCASRYVECVV